MSDPQGFRVVRPHIGDRAYQRGETRTAALADVKALVPHVLQPIDGKADASVDNKAEGAAPANKAATGRKAKPKADTADEGEQE